MCAQPHLHLARPGTPGVRCGPAKTALPGALSLDVALTLDCGPAKMALARTLDKLRGPLERQGRPKVAAQLARHLACRLARRQPDGACALLQAARKSPRLWPGRTATPQPPAGLSERLSGSARGRSAARRLDRQLQELRTASRGTTPPRQHFQRAAAPKKATSETGCSKTISAASLRATRRRVPGVAINSARRSSSAYQ